MKQIAVGVVCICLAWPAPARGQGTLAALPVGERVRVTTAVGERLTGTIETASLTGITVAIERTTRGIMLDRTTRVLPAPEIRTVEHQDSLWNGAWIGVGIGFGSLYVTTQFAERDEHARGHLFGYFFIPSLLVGAIGGAVVDAFKRKTLYERGGAAVMFSPTVSPEHVGGQVAVFW